MLKLILTIVSLISISRVDSSSKNVNHDKCVGLRYFKERRMDLAVKHLLRSRTQYDKDTAYVENVVLTSIIRKMIHTHIQQDRSSRIVFDDGETIEYD